METFNIFFKYQGVELEGTVLPVVIDGNKTYYNVVATNIDAAIEYVWVDKTTGKDSGLAMILGEAIERAEA